MLKKFLPQWMINKFWHLPVAVAANIIYGFPARKLTVIGVTGTDGKTTTVNMLYKILKDAGKKVSMVSTINASVGGKTINTGFHVTSPDPTLVQKLLRQSVDKGDEFAVLEVTSHALDQYRFWGVNFDVGIITNITHEHLDYHKKWEDYFRAKSKLVQSSEFGVISRDEAHFEKLKKLVEGKIISFGYSKDADFNPRNFPLKLQISGAYNVLNALTAAAVCRTLGISGRIVKSSLENFQSPEGRMQEVPNKLGIKIVIDFAHTPNALENALKTLRVGTSGKIIAVFGCAGQRDEQKRELMGEIATKLADKIVITAEDPRGELEEINQQIFKGTQRAGGKLGKNVYIENDRGKAVFLAIKKLAKKGDCVGIFGKGHEKSMNLDGKKEIPWSDQQAVMEALKISNG